MAITTRELLALSKQSGIWKSEPIEHGHGSLAFRGLKNKAVGAYFRYIDNGKRVSLPIGRWCQEGESGLTLDQIRVIARDMARQHASGVTAIKEKVDADNKQANDLLRKQTEGTFGQLLNAYVAGLRTEGRSSASDVDNQIRVWITEKHPELLKLKASSISKSDVMRILSLPVQAGKTRTVNMLRSYLLAAFNKAIDADGNVLLSSSIGGYEIVNNPVGTIKRVQKFDAKRERFLSVTELKSYMEKIKSLPFIQYAALELCLRLGGQRPQQLIRLLAEDIDLEQRLIKLSDSKGKRATPRAHWLPIPERVLPMIIKLVESKSNGFIFDALHIDTLSHRINVISQGEYQMKDIRRTCETMLSGLGISKDIRAQLLSHGLNGVQDTHYDKHDYLREKDIALARWNSYLDEIASGDKQTNIVPLRGKIVNQ